MGFWGMSKEGKDAKKKQAEIAASNLQQSKDWYAKSTGYGQVGDQLRDWGIDYYKGSAGSGIPGVSDIRATGQEIMPGVDDAIARRQARLQQISDAAKTIPGANQTTDAIRSTVGNYGDQIGQNIRDTYGNLALSSRNDYAAMRKGGADVYRGLGANADKTYDTAYSDLEQLRPGSEASIARTARSFAPQIAATAGRLRRAGAGGSLQGESLMRGVETARSRAMDDAAITGARDYVDRKTSLGLSQQQARERLGLGALDYDTTMGREQTALERGYNETGAGLTRNELQRRSDIESNLPLLNRGLSAEDYDRNAGNLAAQNQEELTALGLKGDEWNAGYGYTMADKAARDEAAGNLMNIGQGQYANMFNSAGQGQSFGQDANRGYQNIYDREKASAGWGLKLLGGIGGAALNMVAPGAGKILGGTPAYGGQGQGGGISWGSALNTFNPFKGRTAGNTSQPQSAWMYQYAPGYRG